MNTVLISGDSWGQGEIDYQTPGIDDDWSPIGDSILHRGINQYLEESNFNVINLSYPGGSNCMSTERLKNFLNINITSNKDISCILFFYTEWFREMWYFPNERINKDVKKGYRWIKKRWSERAIERLVSLNKCYNIPIYLIGGCSDIPFSKHSVLTVACQSAVNYITTGNSTIDSPVLCQFNPGYTDSFLDLIKPKGNTEDLQELTTDMEMGQKRIEYMCEPDNAYNYFKPDGIHANRTGHKILFNLVYNTHIQKQKEQNDAKRSATQRTNHPSNGGTPATN